MKNCIVFLTFTFLVAGTVPVLGQNYEEEETIKSEAGKNLIKVNLFSLPLRNVSLQYERPVAKKISVAFGARLMPEGPLPLMSVAKKIAKRDNIDDDISDQLDNFRIGNFALTPEVRFYMGKQALRGFYIAPFARYATFDVTLPFDLETEDANNQVTTERIDMKGDLSTIAGGILIGAQWKLSKMVYLDWHIVGPHYGKAKGNLSGNKNMTQAEQDDLRLLLAELEDDIPFVKLESNVNASGAQIKVNGPWAGIRTGLSLGIRF